MRIPKKLGNCTIENSLYAFEFSTPFNRLYIENTILEKLEQSGSHFERFPVVNEPECERNNALSCYTNQVFKFIIDENRITFNIVNKYPQWAVMGPFITKVIKGFPSDGLLFKTVTTRYISRYDNIPLFNHLNGNVHLNAFREIIGAELRYPVTHGQNIQGFVRITNLLPQGNNVFSSFADVEIRKVLDESSIDCALSSCDEVHKLEKENFFKLLNEEFINSLNPEY